MRTFVEVVWIEKGWFPSFQMWRYYFHWTLPYFVTFRLHYSHAYGALLFTALEGAHYSGRYGTSPGYVSSNLIYPLYLIDHHTAQMHTIIANACNRDVRFAFPRYAPLISLDKDHLFSGLTLFVIHLCQAVANRAYL